MAPHNSVHRKSQPGTKRSSSAFKGKGQRLGGYDESVQPKNVQNEAVEAQLDGKEAGELKKDNKIAEAEVEQVVATNENEQDTEKKIREIQAAYELKTYRKLMNQGTKASKALLAVPTDDISDGPSLIESVIEPPEYKPCLYGDWTYGVGWKSGHRDTKRQRVRNDWRVLTGDEIGKRNTLVAGMTCYCKECCREHLQDLGDKRSKELEDAEDAEKRRRHTIMRAKFFEEKFGAGHARKTITNASTDSQTGGDGVDGVADTSE